MSEEPHLPDQGRPGGAGGPPEAPDEPPRITFRGRRQPRRFHLGWPVLAAIGAAVGFLTGGWPGLIVGGVLGYLIWRLR